MKPSDVLLYHRDGFRTDGGSRVYILPPRVIPNFAFRLPVFRILDDFVKNINILLDVVFLEQLIQIALFEV